jgi:hypothetical protein
MGCSPPGKAGGAAETTRRAVTEEHDMRRAIPILAAALLASGAGCTTRNCDYGTLTIDWSFTDAAGNVLGCADAGVSTVRVTIDGVADDWDCQPFGDGVEGITYQDFTTSTHTVQVEGLDENQQQLYLYPATDVRTDGCGDVPIDAQLEAVQGTLQIDYAIETGACLPGSYIQYSLFDVTGNQVYSAVDTFTIPCSDSTPVLFFDKVPFGQYQLDFIQTVLPPGQAVDGNCNGLTIDHFSNDAITATLYEIGQPGDLSSCPIAR